MGSIFIVYFTNILFDEYDEKLYIYYVYARDFKDSKIKKFISLDKQEVINVKHKVKPMKKEEICINYLNFYTLNANGDLFKIFFHYW